ASYESGAIRGSLDTSTLGSVTSVGCLVMNPSPNSQQQGWMLIGIDPRREWPVRPAAREARTEALVLRRARAGYCPGVADRGTKPGESRRHDDSPTRREAGCGDRGSGRKGEVRRRSEAV